MDKHNSETDGANQESLECELVNAMTKSPLGLGYLVERYASGIPRLGDEALRDRLRDWGKSAGPSTIIDVYPHKPCETLPEYVVLARKIFQLLWPVIDRRQLEFDRTPANVEWDYEDNSLPGELLRAYADIFEEDDLTVAQTTVVIHPTKAIAEHFVESAHNLDPSEEAYGYCIPQFQLPFALPREYND